MLTHLLPEQVADFWDIIKYALEESLPPIAGESPDKMNRVLSAALSGSLDVWASYTKEEVNKFEGIVTTQFLYDDASNAKNLLIYSIYGYEKINRSSWFQGLDTLVKYAKGNNCNQIIAYSSIKDIIDTAKTLGANTEFTLLSFNLK